MEAWFAPRPRALLWRSAGLCRDGSPGSCGPIAAQVRLRDAAPARFGMPKQHRRVARPVPGVMVPLSGCCARVPDGVTRTPDSATGTPLRRRGFCRWVGLLSCRSDRSSVLLRPGEGSDDEVRDPYPVHTFPAKVHGPSIPVSLHHRRFPARAFAPAPPGRALLLAARPAPAPSRPGSLLGGPAGRALSAAAGWHPPVPGCRSMPRGLGLRPRA